jgi:DNA-binding transcriptional MerR regulator
MHSVEDMVRAGCTSRRGVRFWEEKGLLGPVERTAGDTRRYTDEQLNKAKIIAAAQFGGWSLEEISQMLEEWGPEAHEAILTRLADQAMAAARLATDLPKPPGMGETVEFDLDVLPPEYDL